MLLVVFYVDDDPLPHKQQERQMKQRWPVVDAFDCSHKISRGGLPNGFCNMNLDGGAGSSSEGLTNTT